MIKQENPITPGSVLFNFGGETKVFLKGDFELLLVTEEECKTISGTGQVEFSGSMLLVEGLKTISTQLV